MLLARDIMKSKVITVGPQTRLREASEVLLRNGISGVPVVDAHRRVLGVLSQTDILRFGRGSEDKYIPPFYRESGRIVVAAAVESSQDLPVAQVMTQTVLSAEEETPAFELARFMLRRGIHRAMITRGGRLSGIVTSMDMVRVVAQGGVAPRASRRSIGSAPRRGRARARRSTASGARRGES